MSEPSKPCGKCGAPVSGEVAGGFCTACLLEEGLAPAELAQNHIPLRYFGDYELIEEIARGGMGVVFKARQRSLHRIVAVKMILSGHLASEAQMQRFRAEARAASALQHPGIVAIHEVGEHEGLLFFSMDYVASQNLAQLVRDGSCSAMRAAQCVHDIAEAIQYAHEQGVLHRDLKPSNVLIDASGKPHVTDFGLAKQLTSESRFQTSDLTLTGQVLGSPNFMPPEQAAGKHRELTPASDIYWAVVALANHGLKRTNEAVTALSKARELANAKLPKLEAGDCGTGWNDWIITQALLREAGSLIEGTPPDAGVFRLKQ